MIDRKKTWQSLRDFFAGGGKISLPDYDRELLPTVRYREIPMDTPVELFDEIEWKPSPAEPYRITLGDALSFQEEALRKKFWDEMPKDFGVDLARGQSETWLMSYDWETGKMIYRKIDPADMVRPDEGEEGIPDGSN